MNINFNRLRILIHFIVSTVHPHQLMLNSVVSKWGSSDQPAPTCGSICCAAGWTPSVPEFRALGVTYGSESRDSTLMLHGKPAYYDQVVDFLFLQDPEVNERDQLQRLFEPIGQPDHMFPYYNSDEGVEHFYHKAIFLWRAEKMFRKYGQSVDWDWQAALPV